MKLIIKGTHREIQKVLQTITGSQEHSSSVADSSTTYIGIKRPLSPNKGDVWYGMQGITVYH